MTASTPTPGPTPMTVLGPVESSLRGTAVLLVEDNPPDAWLIPRLLNGVRPAADPLVEVDVVERLEDALDRLRRQAFDAVLLDLGLPDSSGLDTFVTIRAAYPHVPVVVLTGLDDEAMALEAVRRGAQDFLVKGRFDAGFLRRALRYAMERQRLQSLLEQLALQDELTRLYNYRGFYGIARQELQAARRREHQALVVSVDLDGLKHVNDTHGHKVGDEVIQAAGEVLRNSFRAADIIGRTGGDEFVVLVRDAAPGTEAIVSERVHFHEAQYNASGVPWRIGFSIGFARDDGHTTLEALVERADAAMYERKQARRAARGAPPG